MMLHNTYNAIPSNSDADLVILDGDDVYNCYLMPGVNNADKINVETLAYWRIEKLAKTEENGVVTYRRLYPNGSTAFTFSVELYHTYDYEYKK